MAAIIIPKTLKGFRDFLPEAEIARKELVDKAEACFRAYGFVPIDTPALEYAEILLGKGGGETEKQIYRFADNGGRDVALRFDLTVPFARFLAAHRLELPIPFKRYHIAKVWRGENTQAGRYREFSQCDFDIVGTDGLAADFEILLVMREALLAIAGGPVTIKINHRGLFNRFLDTLGVGKQAAEVLRVVDKQAKAGRAETLRALVSVVGEEKAEAICAFAGTRGSFEETLAAMTAAAGGPCPESERLAQLYHSMRGMGIEKNFVLDPSITRGLDYYTGIVFESFLNERPRLGSVCSGGRYDNLVGLYSREPLSGVGASIGIDRLIAGLESLGRIEERRSYAQVGIVIINEKDMWACHGLARAFRQSGVMCEVLPEIAGSRDSKRLVKQYVLAEKMGLEYVLVPGDEPLDDRVDLRYIPDRSTANNISFELAVQICKYPRLRETYLKRG
ncbi:MAG: histidine--tRNA ligase [Treponema sp.]|jgi:histidyl-tRNA synthetase|nr:histidine--tRNA ligase [Treponema sp.]